jgi:hypothetical protein
MLSMTPLPPASSRRLDDDPGEASRRSFGGDDEGDRPAGAGGTPTLRIFSGCESMEAMYVSRIRLSSCSGDDHRGGVLVWRRRRSRPSLQAAEPRTVRRPSLVPLPGVVVGAARGSRW